MKRLISKTTLVVLLSLVLVALAEFTPLPRRHSHWVGRWQTSDTNLDESINTLTIVYHPAQDLYNLTWRETYFTLCEGEEGIGRGIGVETADGLSVDLEFYCLGELTLTINVPFVYDPATDTITSDANSLVQTWIRLPLRVPPKPF
jgi:hypothetical protein